VLAVLSCGAHTVAGADAGAAAPIVDGDVTFAIDRQPAVIDTRRSQEVQEYRLVMTAGMHEARFAVHIRPPRFPDGGAALHNLRSSDVVASENVDVGLSSTSSAFVACSPEHNVIHGEEPTVLAYDLRVPAGETGLLDVTFHGVSHDAPFIGMALNPTFDIDRTLVSDADGPATIPHDVILRPHAPRVIGPVGVKIALATDPATAPRVERFVPTYKAGRRFTIRGSTRPRVRHALVLLRALTPRTNRRLRTLARVRTDARGRFFYRWRPRDRGIYELFAFYRSQQPDVTDDRTCPRVFMLR